MRAVRRHNTGAFRTITSGFAVSEVVRGACDQRGVLQGRAQPGQFKFLTVQLREERTELDLTACHRPFPICRCHVSPGPGCPVIVAIAVF